MLPAFTSVWKLPLYCSWRVVSSIFEAVCLQSLQSTNNALNFLLKFVHLVFCCFIFENLLDPDTFRAP